MIQRVDIKGNFKSFFDNKTGFYLRTNVIENGHMTDREPFMAEFPELLDIGIMGHCVHGKSGLCLKSGVQCYQSGGSIQEENMTLKDFEWIVKQCKGRTFQFALGGRGDPDQHEHFEQILQICNENHIVPNFTSSGLGFNKISKESPTSISGGRNWQEKP